jgi:hypothetical protein
VRHRTKHPISFDVPPIDEIERNFFVCGRKVEAPLSNRVRDVTPTDNLIAIFRYLRVHGTAAE